MAPSDVPLLEFPFERGVGLDAPPHFGELRAFGPLARVQLWDGSTPWLVLGLDEAHALLNDSRVSVSRHIHGFPFPTPAREVGEKMERSFIAIDGIDHARYRKMFTKFFSIKRIEALRPDVEKIVDDLLADFLDAGPGADLVSLFAQEVPARVICRVMGIDPRDRSYFQERDAKRNSLTSTGAQVETATNEVLAFVDGLIESKIHEPDDGLISQVVHEQLLGGHVDRPQLAAMLRHLLAAGHETTAQMIGLGTLTLIQTPGAMSILRDQPDAVPGAVEELLRYIPLFQISPNRVAIEPIDIGGVRIESGDGLVIPTAGGNHDPHAFIDPHIFDPHRDAGGHIAFAFGVHQCLGQSLARVELQTVFDRLAQIEGLDLAVSPNELEVRDYLILSLKSLPLTWRTKEQS